MKTKYNLSKKKKKKKTKYSTEVLFLLSSAVNVARISQLFLEKGWSYYKEKLIYCINLVQHVQRPLLSFGPKASMKLKTCPVNVCKVM